MATELKLRRGSTTQNNGFTGASGEITVDTDKKTVVVQDGSTAGGTPLATEANLTTLDNAAVKTTGNQTIAGNKTFSANTDFSAGIDVTGAVKADSIELDQRQDPPATATNGDMYFDSDNQSLYVRKTPSGGTAEWARVTTESSEFIQFKQTQTLSVTPQVGMIYFDSDDQKLKVYTSTNGGQFENLN